MNTWNIFVICSSICRVLFYWWGFRCCTRTYLLVPIVVHAVLLNLLDACIELVHVFPGAFLELLVSCQLVVLDWHHQLLLGTASPVKEVVANEGLLDVGVVEVLLISEDYCLLGLLTEPGAAWRERAIERLLELVHLPHLRLLDLVMRFYCL